jgi:hypothetical protein
MSTARKPVARKTPWKNRVSPSSEYIWLKV